MPRPRGFRGSFKGWGVEGSFKGRPKGLGLAVFGFLVGLGFRGLAGLGLGGLGFRRLGLTGRGMGF